MKYILHEHHNTSNFVSLKNMRFLQLTNIHYEGQTVSRTTRFSHESPVGLGACAANDVLRGFGVCPAADVHGAVVRT